MRHYTVLLFQDPSEPEGWLGAIPAVRGVHSQGDTQQEALSMTTEALEGMLELMIEMGEALPPDLSDLEPAKNEWRELLNSDQIEFHQAQVAVRAEVMAVAA